MTVRVIFAACVMCATTLLHGEVIAEFSGSGTPSEGDGVSHWEQVIDGGRSTAEGPVAGARPAWHIADRANGVLLYQNLPSSELVGKAKRVGWKFSVCLWLGSSNYEGQFPTVSAEYSDAVSGARYRMGYFIDDDGKVGVVINSPQDRLPAFSVEHPEEFHLYELIYEPSAKVAHLLVDGKERMHSIPPLKSSGVSRVAWGCSNGLGTGSADFSLVRLESNR